MLNTKRATLVQLAQYETRYTLVQLAQYKTRFTSLIMLPHCNMRFSELFWICFTWWIFFRRLPDLRGGVNLSAEAFLGTLYEVAIQLAR
jgi:hypothetical protein